MSLQSGIGGILMLVSSLGVALYPLWAIVRKKPKTRAEYRALLSSWYRLVGIYLAVLLLLMLVDHFFMDLLIGM